MRDRAVVALEEVLHADLPVRLELGLGAPDEAKRVDVDSGIGETLGNVVEMPGERSRVRVRVDEDERPPGLDAQSHEADLAAARRLLPATRAERSSRRPSRPYVHAWYGHWSDARRPDPSQTSDPRCRQTLRNARSTPSSSRTRTTGTWPARVTAYEPGSAISSARPAYCHERRKIRSRSRSSAAGSVYQLHGSVRLFATDSTSRL